VPRFLLRRPAVSVRRFPREFISLCKAERVPAFGGAKPPKHALVELGQRVTARPINRAKPRKRLAHLGGGGR